MTFSVPAVALAVAMVALSLPGPAQAGCLAGSGASCLASEGVPARPAALVQMALSTTSAPSAQVAVGAVLPRGKYSLILDAGYYGLPSPSAGWVYMRVGQDAYRVDWQSHQVLERVTDQAAANF
jgi:hypothetical protein